MAASGKCALCVGRSRTACSHSAAPAGHEAGFAAIDALVGLMILAITLVLSFNALTVARDLAASAAEARRAGSLLSFLMESAPGVPGAAAGRAEAFDWRVETAPSGATVGAATLCRRTAQVTARASRRAYSMSALALCRTEKATA